jgi:phosphatidylinositol-3-phosphatase
MSFIRAGRVLSSAIVLVCLAAAVFAQVPSSQHVVLVIDENSSYSAVKSNMPWLVNKGNAYGYATKYLSDSGGSLLDYLWLASGSCESSANCSLPSGTHNFNCNGNACYYPGTTNTDAITDNNIFRVLNNAGISWKVYAQSYAAAGGTVTTPDNHNGTAYYRRHNGATWYSDVINNVSGSAGKVVDLSHLNTDIQAGKLPRFSIIVPDGNHDAHDCPVGMSSCSLAQKLNAADQFLNSTLTPVLNLPDFKSGGTGLVLVTFDECGGGTNAGCGSSVYTALIGPKVKPHTISSVSYKHENALRTILDSLGVKSYPGASANAADMRDFFGTTVASKPVVAVSSPAPGSSVNSPVQIDASATPSAGQSINGWWVYVDSVGVYNGGAASSISPLVKMSPGSHSVVVRAWDTSGGYGDQTLTVTASTATPTVAVSTPSNNVTAGTPVNLQAAASPTAGHSIQSWHVLVDGKSTLSAGASSKVNLQVPLTVGKHTLAVQAYDTSGTYGQQTLTVTASAKPAVTVSTPGFGSNVLSPVKIQASAAPSSGHTITGWWVYVDSVGKYNAGAVNSIGPSISTSQGVHTIIVRAWDSSGAYGDQTFTVDVRPVAVNITNLLNGAQVASTVKLAATASGKYSIASWTVYVDSGTVYRQNYGNTLNTNLNLTTGTHTLMVRSWDTTGAYGDETIKVTVP